MKSTTQIICGILLSATLSGARASQLLDDGFLSKIRSEAARHHPSVDAANHRVAAAVEDIHAVRLWDDPMVGFGIMAANRSMRADQGDIIIGIDQPLPKPGMFAAQRGKAESMRRAELENSRGSSLAAGSEAARTAIELALADESVTLQQTQISWLAAMTENARQMAAGPMGSSMDALRMETELAKEQQMLDAARRTRAGLASKLNLNLGRPLDSPWSELKLPAAPLPLPVAQAEIARIPHANPKVRAMRELVGAARADTRIADRDRLPQFLLGLDTNIYSRGDVRSASLNVKMSLPWFNENSYQAKITGARDREAAAGRDVEAMRREIAAGVLAACTDSANAAAQARAYSGEVHDKALQTSKTIEAAWISSKAPLTDLLDSSRILFSIRLEQRRFIAMQRAALEDLHTLVPNN